MELRDTGQTLRVLAFLSGGFVLCNIWAEPGDLSFLIAAGAAALWFIGTAIERHFKADDAKRRADAERERGNREYAAREAQWNADCAELDARLERGELTKDAWFEAHEEAHDRFTGP